MLIPVHPKAFIRRLRTANENQLMAEQQAIHRVRWKENWMKWAAKTRQRERKHHAIITHLISVYSSVESMIERGEWPVCGFFVCLFVDCCKSACELKCIWPCYIEFSSVEWQGWTSQELSRIPRRDPER
jgi:hypothetical protein